MKKEVLIVTHNLKFHPDDVCGVAVLKMMLGDTPHRVVRTRDESIISSADYVLDVGNVYDPEKNRFDHHQKEGAGTRANGIPYASFGLIWKKYGEMVCGSKEVAGKIDDQIVSPVDAVDNGFEIGEYRYGNISPYTLSDILYAHNPTWKEGMSDIDQRFGYSVQYAQDIITREIKRKQSRVEAENIILQKYTESVDRRVLILDQFYPMVEDRTKIPELLFVVYPLADDTWGLDTISVDSHSYVSRKYLPDSWAGKRDVELEEVTGVRGAVFVHRDKFFAVAKTKEAILKMAEIALEA